MKAISESRPTPKRLRGTSLIEVLVAIVVLSTGLLGMVEEVQVHLDHVLDIDEVATLFAVAVAVAVAVNASVSAVAKTVLRNGQRDVGRKRG